MKIRFFGAARTVTGSSYYLEMPGLAFVVDCGMFQGNRKLQERNTLTHFPPVKDLPYLLLTHAHIDHCGLIPLLVKKGFCGKILCTAGTKDLCELMLKDSAHVQQMDAEWQNRRNLRSGRGHVEALYTMKEAENSLRYFLPVSYDELIQLTPDVQVKFRDAGHILGSAIIECWWKEGGEKFKLVFSGDLGSLKQPIIKDPSTVEEADFLLIESTYGNRLHKSFEDTEEELLEVVKQAFRDREKVIIPAFAVERTQDIIYTLGNLSRREQLPPIPIYVDSPLATSTTEVFRRYTSYFDEESRAMLANGSDPLDLPGLRFSRTSEESKAINETREAAIIISASGMCDAGRIKHHLKHNIWRAGAHIVFTGYQAVGTLGREIVEGKKLIKILGEEVQVKAHIHTLGGFSAHADQKGLLTWLANLKNPRMKLFVVHGEEKVALEFAGAVKERFTFDVVVPQWKETFELAGLLGAVPQPECVEVYEALSLLEKNLHAMKTRLQDGAWGNDTAKRERMMEKLKELNSGVEEVLRSP